jgi:hypothetical protein
MALKSYSDNRYTKASNDHFLNLGVYCSHQRQATFRPQHKPSPHLANGPAFDLCLIKLVQSALVKRSIA